ncbi:MAG: aspartate kinase [Snowella sp.]|jgi:aspartate kinase|nr:MAG: aspartate kinase [Snowella sp.]
MSLIVQKYGGTSVGTVDRIQAVAQRVQKTVRDGHSVVVVVSAMGKTTDTLVNLAQAISPNPSRREMDMLLSTGEQVSIALLSMALQELGQAAISLTGAQVGIVTEAEHSRARILEIKPDRLKHHLDEGKVIVVAGFQGISSIDHLEITTLGRGGSDTSAVALAAALKADLCEIYTDVPGILTTDPRLVPEAQLLEEITCDEMLELASLGANVLHPRAVEIARNFGVLLVVRSSWSDAPGTRVVAPPPKPRSLVGLEITKAVDSVEFDPDQAKVALLRIPDRPGIAAKLFGEISHQRVDVDLIIQSIHEGNSNDIAFTVVKKMLTKAESVTEAIAPALREHSSNTQEAEVIVEKRVAKIAIAGAGIIGRPGIAAKMFKTLADAKINIEMISTSEVKVSCLIDEANGDLAIEALCKAFGVNQSPPTNASLFAHLPPVRGVALDLKRAQVGIRHIPDRPGMAAQIFMALADQNISVDMIIQSQRCRIIEDVPRRDIAFTIAENDIHTTRTVLEKLAVKLGLGEVVINEEVAKVSIVGSGMVGHPGVAAKFFNALAKEKINIEMIATSEIKVSCIVSQADAVRALKCIHETFGLAGKEVVNVPA